MGSNVKLQQSAMKAWASSGILTAEEKQVLDSPEVVELGVRIDGQRGLLGASPARTLKTLWASVHLLRTSRWDKRLAQVILGRWVFYAAVPESSDGLPFKSVGDGGDAMAPASFGENPSQGSADAGVSCTPVTD